MTAEEFIGHLDLPANTRVDQRVPKKLLVENGAPTAADKKLINENIEEVQWVAALQPSNIGVQEYRDEIREYLEIEVIVLTLRGPSGSRLSELAHRAIPYPVLLVTESGNSLNLSIAHKRWSQGEAGKVILEDKVIAADLIEAGESIRTAFLSSVGLGEQSQTNMMALYQGWASRIIALKAAERTGLYAPSPNAEQAERQKQALEACNKLEREIAMLRNSAKKERQTAKLVELNLELKRLQAALDAARGNLQ